MPGRERERERASLSLLQTTKPDCTVNRHPWSPRTSPRGCGTRPGLGPKFTTTIQPNTILRPQSLALCNQTGGCLGSDSLGLAPKGRKEEKERAISAQEGGVWGRVDPLPVTLWACPVPLSSLKHCLNGRGHRPRLQDGSPTTQTRSGTVREPGTAPTDNLELEF